MIDVFVVISLKKCEKYKTKAKYCCTYHRITILKYIFFCFDNYNNISEYEECLPLSTLIGDTSEVLVMMDKPRVVGRKGSGPGAYLIMCDCLNVIITIWDYCNNIYIYVADMRGRLINNSSVTFRSFINIAGNYHSICIHTYIYIVHNRGTPNSGFRVQVLLTSLIHTNNLSNIIQVLL